MIDMRRVMLTPADKEDWLAMRESDITSTQSPALFGLSPYTTKFELYHAKRGDYTSEFKSNDRVAWGLRLESSIAQGAAEDNGWEIEPLKDYGRIPEARIGSSFDFRILSPSDDAGLLEVKNIDRFVFNDGWVLDSGQIEAPPHIELQAQHEMLVSGDDRITIAGLVGGNDLKLIRREADEEVQRLILEKVAEFWESVNKAEEPPPLFPADSDFVAKLYQYAEPGLSVDMAEDKDLLDLLAKYQEESKAKNTANKNQKDIKAKILLLIGGAEKVTASPFTVSAGMVGPSKYEVDRKAYRNFRISKRNVREERTK